MHERRSVENSNPQTLPRTINRCSHGLHERKLRHFIPEPDRKNAFDVSRLNYGLHKKLSNSMRKHCSNTTYGRFYRRLHNFNHRLYKKLSNSMRRHCSNTIYKRFYEQNRKKKNTYSRGYKALYSKDFQTEF